MYPLTALTALITGITGHDVSYSAERLLDAVRLRLSGSPGLPSVLAMTLVRRELEQMQPDGQLAASGGQP